MSAVIAPVSALLLSVALLLMGHGLQGTLLPVRAELEAFGTFNIGVLGSAYFIGFAGGCLLGARVVRRVGHIRTFTALTAIAAAAALVHALAVDIYAWWGLRAVTGFCLAGLYLVIESWLNERATNATRGMILSIYTMINLTVMTLGQLMIVLYDPQAFPLFALASILVSLAAVPVALTTSAAPTPPETVQLRPQRTYKASPVGLMGCFAAGLANGPFWALGPVFAVGVGLDTRGVAVFMALVVIAGAIGQWPLGRLSDRIDRRKVIVAACVLAAMAGAGQFITSAYWTQGVLAMAFAFGLFAIPLYALCVAHANDFVDPREFVEASGTLLLANALGSILGPLLAALAMARLGPPGLFAVSALAHTGMAAFAMHRMRQRAAPAPEERTPFVPVPRTTPELAELDPRSETELRGE
ncbi:MFS transporter [Ferruginivarius sediminum]|uniref:MFS transporter n=1 Tax=Ferruginivarius sediminum TaxID=2661937 RepID=A0A369TC12_9PROT|nr:MFS transporter [Ferruginivarius sediminum]RDD62818.1 MFS transporter [Ferruginivarius sediminum]